MTPCSARMRFAATRSSSSAWSIGRRSVLPRRAGLPRADHRPQEQDEEDRKDQKRRRPDDNEAEYAGEDGDEEESDGPGKHAVSAASAMPPNRLLCRRR